MMNSTDEARKRGKKEERGEYEEELVLKRSNRLIKAKDNLGTLNQRKVIAYAIATAIVDDTGNPTSEFRVGELTQFEGMDKKNISRTFRQMENDPSINKTIIIPKKNGGFEMIGMIDSLEYNPVEGKVKVRFTQAFGKHINDIPEAYTKNSLVRLFLFKKISSYRIYELLSTKEYLLKENPKVYITFDLQELKRMIGLSKDGLEEYYEETLTKKLKRPPTAAELYEAYPEVEPYSTYKDFRRNVLEVAQKEFIKLADEGEEMFTFDFEPIKGARGKVYQIKFTIYPPALSYERTGGTDEYVITGDGKDQVEVLGRPRKHTGIVDPVVTEAVREIFTHGEPLTDQNIHDLYSEAGGDIERIRKAYALMRTQEGIGNTIGWMRKAIRDNYESSFPSDRHFDYEGKIRADRIWEDYQKKRENTVQMVNPQVLYEELERMDKTGELDRDGLDKVMGRYMCITEKSGNSIIYAKECLTIVSESVYQKNVTTTDKLRLLESAGYDVIACLGKLSTIFGK